MNAPRPRPGVLKYELLLLLVTAIWGFAFPAQQIGMAKGLGPMTFTAMRFALGALVLVPVVLWRPPSAGEAGASGKFPVRGSLAAGAFLFAAAGTQQVGLLYTSSANSGFITGFYILFVPLIGLLFGHRAPKSLWAGVAVCLLGFYLLSVTGRLEVCKGDWLTLVCAVLWACQILTIDCIAARGDSIRIAALQFAVCAVLSAVCALLFERCTLEHVKAASGVVAYAGVLSVGVAFTLQVVCQKHCPPGPAAVIMSMEAIFAALAGYMILNQTLSARAVAGCALILCGVLIVQLVPMLGRRRTLQVAGAELTNVPR
jgi:drug/metabolite transporter (DMT)-like permease